MPNLHPHLETEVSSPDSNAANMTEYISVGDALKLVALFNGKKRAVLAFIANEDTEFEVNDPRNGVLCLNSCWRELVGNPGLPLRIGIWTTGKS
jgi:hypothetical protein